MGFLIKRIFYIVILGIVISGCSRSLIQIQTPLDENPYAMFGRIPGREFFYNSEIPDSIKELWNNDINGGFNNSSITGNGNFVFVNDLSGRIFCFNINDGKEAGQLKTKGSVYTTPVIYKNLIIFVSVLDNEDESNLIYYNFIEGNELKVVSIKGKVLTQLIKIDDGIIFTTDHGEAYKFNFEGTQLWKTDTKISTHSSPAMGNNILVYGNDEGEIIGINQTSGKILYQKKLGGSFWGAVSIYKKNAFLGNDDNKLYSINIENGNINWTFNSGERILMAPVAFENEIVVGTLTGKLFMLDKNTGRQIWKSDIEGVLNASPLVTKNYIIAPNLNGKIYFVKTSNGKIVKKYELPNHAKLSPAIFKNKLFIGYDDGNLASYEFVK